MDLSTPARSNRVDIVEAVTLLELRGAAGQHAVRAALGALGMLRIIRPDDDTKRRWLSQPRVLVMPLTVELRSVLHPAMTAVHDTLSRADRGGGTQRYTMTEILALLQKEYGVGYGSLIDLHVVPRLLEKGLIERRLSRFLMLFKRSQLELTAAGAQLRTEILATRAQAEALPALIRKDPHSAALKCVELGPALMLARHLQPHLRKLSGIVRDQQTGRDIAGLFDDVHERRAGWLETVDMVGMTDWSAVFDAIDGAFDASGGGDGGGDGGGGDGSD